MAGCMYCMYIVLSIRYAGLLQKISILHFSWVSYSSLPTLKTLLCGSAGTGWPLHWPQRTLLLHWVSDPCLHHLWDTSEWKALFGVQDMLTIHLLPFIPAAYKFKKIKLPSTCCGYRITTSVRISGERAWALLWFQPGWYSSTNRQHLLNRHTVAGMGWHLERPCKTNRDGANFQAGSQTPLSCTRLGSSLLDRIWAICTMQHLVSIGTGTVWSLRVIPPQDELEQSTDCLN